jgi:DNA polymerase
MLIGEAPGEEEAETGIPFYGNAGKLLNQIIAMTSDDPGIRELYDWYCKVKHTEANTDYFRDKMLEYRKQELFITNAVSCRPPDNRTPTHKETKACWERLYNLIYIVDPLLIITSGKTSLEAVLRRQMEVTKVRGHVFDITVPGRVRDVTYPVVATLHPSYLLRVADWKDKSGNCMKTVQDFLSAFRMVDELRQRYYGTPIPLRTSP